MKIFFFFASFAFASILRSKFNDNSHFSLSANGLEVFILRSSLTDFSLLGLSISISKSENPQGLLHLIEHLIINGMGSYDISIYNFIENNSGEALAFTSQSGLNFEIRIPTNLLEETMARFTNVLINPNFDQYFPGFDSQIKEVSELHTIHREFETHKDDPDFIRGHFYSMHDPFPYNRFICGNSKTLHSDNPKELLKAVKQFYEQNISSTLMKLVVISNSPITEVQSMISKHFSGIRKLPVSSRIRHGKITTGRIIKHNSKDGTTLIVTIPISIDSNYPAEAKLFEFLSHLIVAQSPNSLYHELAKKGYISSCKSKFKQLKTYGKIWIICNLTECGEKNIEFILKMHIAWIELLTKGSLKEQELYEEFICKSQLEEYSNPLDIDYIGKLSKDMQRMDIEKSLAGESQYDEKVMRYYFSKVKMTKRSGSKILFNFNATLGTTSKEDQNFELSDVDFQLEYSNQPLNFKVRSENFGFEYPILNPYSFVGPLEITLEKDQTVNFSAIKKYSGIWVKEDFPVKSPQIAIKLSFLLKRFDVKSRQLFKVYFSLIEAELIKDINLAMNAGFLVSFNYKKRNKIELSISGFGPDQALGLFNLFLDAAKNKGLKKILYEARKKMLIQDLEMEKEDIYSLFSKHYSQIISNINISDEEELKITKSLTGEDFDVFMEKEVFNNLAPSVFIMSTNIKEGVIEKTIDKIRSIFKAETIQTQLPELNGRNFSYGPCPDSSSIFSISKVIPTTLGQEAMQTAFVFLFEKIFYGHLYRCIRTDDHLAYEFTLKVMNCPGNNLILFFIKTSCTEKEIEKRIYKFLQKEASNLLDFMLDSDLEKIRDSLALDLRPTQLDFDKTFNLIWEESPDFDFFPQVVASLRSLGPSQIKEEMNKILEFISDPLNGFKVTVLGGAK
jgi:secreted Zn-dependent insulinase-like peptidase